MIRVFDVVDAPEGLVVHSDHEGFRWKLQLEARTAPKWATSIVEDPARDALLAKVILAFGTAQWLSQSMHANATLEVQF